MSLYEDAARLMPRVECLRCTVCGYVRPLNERQAAINMSLGWPKCCGLTMYLHTENDPAPAPAAGREGEPATPGKP